MLKLFTMRIPSFLSHVPTALILVLWFGATFFFLGDTGKHSDDYTVALRDRATGAIDVQAHPWIRWPYFWRPFHLAHACVINTISWNHPWIGHFELAIIHGFVTWMLAGLMNRLDVRRWIAWTTALHFLTCPLNGEAVGWTSASCNAISALFLLRTLELARRQATGPESRLRYLWIGVLAFITACWYEPAAAALAAVPLVFLAAGTDPLRSRLLGMVRCTASASAGCLLYVALLIATAPTKNRGGTESLVTLHQLAPRTRFVFVEGLHATFGERGRDIIAGSIENGWQTLQTLPGFAFISVAVLLALFTVWFFVSVSRSPVVTPSKFSSTGGVLLLPGLAIFLFSWIPLIAVDGQPIELRSLYIPMLGLVMMATALANAIATLAAGATLATRRGVATLSFATALAAAVAGMVGMIGFQAQFRLNTSHDRSTVEHLRMLVPDPPSKTIFLPLSVDTHGAATGHFFFDRAIHGVFDTPWSCRPIVNATFRRTDVNATPVPSWFKNLDDHGVFYLHLPKRQDWNRCIPFVVRSSGEVCLVRRLTIVPGVGPPFIIDFPRIPASSPADDTADIRLRELEHGTDHAHCVTDLRRSRRE